MAEEKKGVVGKVEEVATKGLAGQLSLEQVVALEAGTKGLTKAFELFGMQSNIVTKNIQGFGQAIKNLNQESTLGKNLMSSLGSAIKLNFGDALQKITGQLATAAGGVQSFQKDLAKLGQDKSFQENARAQAVDLAKLGINYKDIQGATTELIKNYNASVRITGDQSKSFDDNSQALIRLTTYNEKLGVSQKNTAGVINYTKDVIGGGTDAAIKLSDTLDKFAKTTGQSTADVFERYNQSMDRFAVVSSEKAVQGFEKLELMSKRTGQSMEQMFGTLRKFDDIDKGFEAGGQLNRVLSFMGGSFDTFTAMQADDEERAKMIYESIGGVADQFQALQSDQAKRAFATQLSEATGIDMKTVVGLLNKSTDLSKDVMDISKAPIVKEGYTEKERTERMAEVTTSEDLRTATGQLLEATKAALSLAETMKAGARVRGGAEINLLQTLDKNLFAPLVSGNQAKIKEMTDSFKTSATAELKKAFSDPAAVFSDAVKKFEKLMEPGRPPTAGYPTAPAGSPRAVDSITH